jgi:hypothetical protein
VKSKINSDLHRHSGDKKEVEFEEAKHDLIIPIHSFDRSIQDAGRQDDGQILTLHLRICAHDIKNGPPVKSDEFARVKRGERLV